jgi:hypothetical protein
MGVAAEGASMAVAVDFTVAVTLAADSTGAMVGDSTAAVTVAAIA